MLIDHLADAAGGVPGQRLKARELALLRLESALQVLLCALLTGLDAFDFQFDLTLEVVAHLAKAAVVLAGYGLEPLDTLQNLPFPALHIHHEIKGARRHNQHKQ